MNLAVPRRSLASRLLLAGAVVQLMAHALVAMGALFWLAPSFSDGHYGFAALCLATVIFVASEPWLLLRADDALRAENSERALAFLAPAFAFTLVLIFA